MNKTIVISAINFFQGGPLRILMHCLEELSSSRYYSFDIYILVHRKSLFEGKNYPDNFFFKEYPNSRKSYIYRLYYEYIFFGIQSSKIDVRLWLSLHDITPRNIKADVKAVYCHNPTPFYKKSVKDILYLNLFMFTWLYKYFYRINIHTNNFVIVQQQWIKQEFMSMFNIDSKKIIVAKPIENLSNAAPYKKSIIQQKENNKKLFFYPTFPRPFKNIEIIVDAVSILSDKYENKFEVIITINGKENLYSKRIVKYNNGNKHIKFIGQQDMDQVYEYYSKCDCLIFPSKLETWGLPISEFKQFCKPMFIPNLPYASETVSNYQFPKFFDPNNASSLAKLMALLIDNNLHNFDKNEIYYQEEGNVTTNWEELFDKLLEKTDV